MKRYNRDKYKRAANPGKPVKILLRYVRENWDLFPLFLFLALLLEIGQMIARVFFAEIIRVIEVKDFGATGELFLFILVLGVINLKIDILFHRVIIDKLEYKLVKRMVLQLMDHLEVLGIDFYSGIPAAIIKSRINKIYVLAGLIQQAGWGVITHLLQIIVSLVLIFVYLPTLWAVVLTVLIVYTITLFMWLNIVMMRNQTPTRRRRQDNNEGIDEVRDWLIDMYTTLLTNSSIPAYKKKLAHNYRRWQKVGMLDLEFALSGIGIQRDYVLIWGRRASLGIAILLLISGVITLPELVLFNTVIETLFIGMWSVTRFLYMFVHESESLIKLQEILDMEPRIITPENPQEIPAGAFELTLKDVSFTYPVIQLDLDEDEERMMSRDNTNGHLQSIDLEIPAGSRVGILGTSGAGKSTLSSILDGRRRATSGSVLINDLNIDLADPLEVFARTALVPQGTAIDLLNSTLRENLCLGHNYSEPELIQALEDSSLWETVQEWENGLDEKVGERGRTLSGGQQQRVAIARALLRKPDLLILDEATSSLDPVTERAVQTAIDSLPGSTTVVIIAHRLSTIRNADMLIMMDKGQIIAQGSWQQMLETSPEFRQMVELQNLD